MNKFVCFLLLYAVNVQAQIQFDLSNCCEGSQSTLTNENCIITHDDGAGNITTIDNRNTGTIVAEDNDNLQNGRFNFSYGNGVELLTNNVGNWGAGFPYDVEIVKIMYQSRTTTGATGQHQIYINNAPVGSILVTQPNSNKEIWDVSQQVLTGDVFNLYTIIGNNITDATITVWFKYCAE